MPQGGPRWNFVFSDIDRRGEPRWYRVVRDGTVAIDPIGRLDFRTRIEGTKPPCAGEDFRVQPQLFTGDGLLIVTCYRGMVANPTSDSAAGATIDLTAADSHVLASAHSGFA